MQPLRAMRDLGVKPQRPGDPADQRIRALLSAEIEHATSIDSKPAPRRRVLGLPISGQRVGTGTLTGLAAVLAVAAVAAVVAVIIAYAHPSTTSTRPTTTPAAVARGNEHGTIVIESQSSVERLPHGSYRWHSSDITRYLSGRGPENFVFTSANGLRLGAEQAQVNGNNALYDPSTNTVYITSMWASHIKPGPRRGSYLLTIDKSRSAPKGSGGALRNTRLPATITINAKTRRALLDGSDVVGSDTTHRILVRPAVRGFSEAAEINAMLLRGKLRRAGASSVDGRPAIKLDNPHGHAVYYVTPRTHEPIRTEIGSLRTGRVITTYHGYRVVPSTPANQRLLSLTDRHPGARVDHSQADYNAAKRRLLK